MAQEEFSGEYFVVTGGSSGIGFAVARALHERGAELLLVSRNPQKLQEAAAALGNARVSTLPLDIAREDAASRLVAALPHGREIRGLLLNAGGPPARPLDEISWTDLEAAHALLLAGPIRLLMALQPRMANGRGSVVAITSSAVFEPLPGLALSSAYRQALTTLLKEFADMLGKRGIRVNAVAPGFTATERLGELAERLTAAVPEGEKARAREEIRKGWAVRSPMGRMAEPAEIASTCLFLFSQASSFVTRQTLVADGGSLRAF